MASPPRTSARTTLPWIILLVALAVLSLLAMRRSMGRAMGMNAETTDSNTLPGLKVGDEAKVALEITSQPTAASIEGNVLEKQTESIYARTGKKVKILFDATTPVVMGAMSDVHAGAVVHVKAKVQGNNQLRAEQIVVLSGSKTRHRMQHPSRASKQYPEHDRSCSIRACSSRAQRINDERRGRFWRSLPGRTCLLRRSNWPRLTLLESIYPHGCSSHPQFRDYCAYRPR